MRFTIATYNIHKGFSHLKRRMVIHELREKLHGLDADILFLQEVQGANERHAGRYVDWPGKPQHEFIADKVWQEIAYGKTAIYRHGHHGNAVLSRFPILSYENQDISAHAFESRALLHCKVRLGQRGPVLHCMNVHLGLFERGRQWQIRALCERIRATVPRDAALIIAGDFNDWRQRASGILEKSLGMTEVSMASGGRHSRTFPSVLPMFRLDRIYVRGFKVLGTQVHRGPPWSLLSDHLAVSAELERA